MDLRVKWNKGLSFIASSKAGHEIVMDGPADLGGVIKECVQWKYCYLGWEAALHLMWLVF